MGIFNTRNPVINTQQWIANGYATSSVQVPNTAPGVDVVAASGTPNTPRYVYLTVDATVNNAAPVYFLLGSGTVSATNYSFILDPGITFNEQISAEKISALSTTANSQTVRVAIAPGAKV